jgi:predicted ArsR family transcriptional regulator
MANSTPLKPVHGVWLSSRQELSLTQFTSDGAAAWSIEDLERLAGAIQDPTRRGILLAAYNTDKAFSVDDVAKRVGVHRTVAFGHLERLVALGYLAISWRRGFPGKPAKLYRRSSDDPLLFRYPARQAALLADTLAEALAGFGQEGREAAKDIGRRRGLALRAHGRSVEEVLQSVAFLGGDYRLADRSKVVAGNCIFREACTHNQPLICGLHSGLIEGLLAGAGIRRTVTPAADAPGVCAYSLSSG